MEAGIDKNCPTVRARAAVTDTGGRDWRRKWGEGRKERREVGRVKKRKREGWTRDRQKDEDRGRQREEKQTCTQTRSSRTCVSSFFKQH